MTYFFGLKGEKREGMEITRVTSAYARPSAFVFDHAAGTATVRPPYPFSGHAVYKRHPHGHSLWKSTISVPILGSEPLSLGGRDFRVALVRATPSGERPARLR